jgi:hypothetical protein
MSEKIWDLLVCKERLVKQAMVMKAIHEGSPNDTRIRWDEPRDLPSRFMVCGQLWMVERIIPRAVKEKTPFWMIDNGYYMQSGKGKHETGHWELTYRGLEPILMRDPDFSRLPAEKHLKPWRDPRAGSYVLIGHPGPGFGRSFGYNMTAWSKSIVAEVRKRTKLPIVERDKWSDIPLEKQLAGARVLVTHSSHVVIDAVRNGVPAIVAPSSPAAPVCSTSLDEIEEPRRPDRTHWWASLMSQQFTLAEMRSGLAFEFAKKIMEQVDGV